MKGWERCSRKEAKSAGVRAPLESALFGDLEHRLMRRMNVCLQLRTLLAWTRIGVSSVARAVKIRPGPKSNA